jgi:hypothetical protein
VYSTDREQFDVQLALLCQGYGFWVGDRADAYWKGLEKMSVSAFARCVEFAISEGGPEKIPNTHGIWKIYRSLRASAAPPPVVEAVPDQSKWLLWVNGMFLKYLLQRRLTENFKGDINLGARRVECLKLVAFFEAIEAERDPEATEAELRKRFLSSMARIPDAQVRAA